MQLSVLHKTCCTYTMTVLLSLGIFVELPMELEVDTIGAVHLANNRSLSGRTRHIGVRQCFLQELKEKNLIVVKWTPGAENLAVLFTKNLSGPQFKEFVKVFVKEDEYTPEP